jgi:hypothetical protein
MKLDYTENKRTVYVVACGLGETVEVFGDPENASYEWLIRKDGEIECHSNDGYGDDSIALMKGLIEYHQV